jgi:hypothetical protein
MIGSVYQVRSYHVLEKRRRNDASILVSVTKNVEYATTGFNALLNPTTFLLFAGYYSSRHCTSYHPILNYVWLRSVTRRFVGYFAFPPETLVNFETAKKPDILHFQRQAERRNRNLKSRTFDSYAGVGAAKPRLSHVVS